MPSIPIQNESRRARRCSIKDIYENNFENGDYSTEDAYFIANEFNEYDKRNKST